MRCTHAGPVALEYSLDHINKFEGGTFDTFVFQLAHLGNIECATLRRRPAASMQAHYYYC